VEVKVNNIPSFKQYLVEEEREVFFTFGRMNPPTIGHGKLMNVMSAKAGKNPYKVFLSHSQDAKKNPLTYEQKVKHTRKMFPKHARNVILNKKVKKVFDAATSLYEQGFNKITMVVGADRITEFKTLLNKYNGVKGRHGFYNFEKINIVSAGDRDPDAEGVEGMSASKQRENASNNDFTTFAQGVPSSMSNKDAKRLFNDVRAGMGLKETKQFKNHIELEPVSEIREKFVEGELFNEGDNVVIKSSGETGYIHRLGTNYVIVALDEGRVSRQWLDNVELIDEARFGGSSVFRELMPGLDNFLDKFSPSGRKRWKYALQQYQRLTKEKPKSSMNDRVWKAAQIADVDIRGLRDLVQRMNKEGTDRWYKDQPEWGTPEATKKAKKMVPGQNVKEEIKVKQDQDIDDREGSQPARYHKGLSKAQKIARDRQFKKQTKMSDNDPKAYKPAAGDKTTKTKPSTYTKSFKQMFGEEVTQKQITDLEKFADRLLAKFDIDVEFTRHFADRMNDARNNPSISVAELQRFFKKVAKEKGKNIKANVNAEVVLKDIQSDLNLPVAIKLDRKNDEIDVVNKTIMRKKDFKTSNKTVQYEDAVADAKKRIEREKEQDKIKFDRMMDRARLTRARNKNKGISQ
jgi:hypothetical protein